MYPGGTQRGSLHRYWWQMNKWTPRDVCTVELTMCNQSWAIEETTSTCANSYWLVPTLKMMQHMAHGHHNLHGTTTYQQSDVQAPHVTLSTFNVYGWTPTPPASPMPLLQHTNLSFVSIIYDSSDNEQPTLWTRLWLWWLILTQNHKTITWGADQGNARSRSRLCELKEQLSYLRPSQLSRKWNITGCGRNAQDSNEDATRQWAAMNVSSMTILVSDILDSISIRTLKCLQFVTYHKKDI